MNESLAEFRYRGSRATLYHDRIRLHTLWNRGSGKDIYLSSVTSIELNRSTGKLRILFSGGVVEISGGWFDRSLPRFAEQVQQQIVRQAGPRDGTAPGAAPAGGRDAELDELERLHRLRGEGALTDDEFQRLKQRLLAGSART